MSGLDLSKYSEKNFAKRIDDYIDKKLGNINNHGKNKGNKRKLRICLFHPYFKSKGGAEATVLSYLQNTKNYIDIYTWLYEKEKTFEEFGSFNIVELMPIFSNLSKAFLLRSVLLLFGRRKMRKVFQNNYKDKYYDAILMSTSGLAELMLPSREGEGFFAPPVFVYSHTPLRAACDKDIDWNLKNKYKINADEDHATKNPFNYVKALIYLIAVYIYDIFEKKSWKNINYVMFNSKLSLERAERKHLLYRFRSTNSPIVINPPIKNKYTLESLKKAGIKIKSKNYFLCVSRFHPLKRQDLLIKIWDHYRFYASKNKKPMTKLIFVGSSENKKYLKMLRKMVVERNLEDFVEFKPDVSDQELQKLYAECAAGIFIPFEEDFGMTPFEFASIGKTIIATDSGGFVDILKDYKQYIPIKEKILESFDKVNYLLMN